MRIAYIANYQGPDLIDRRGIHRNLALAGSQKIQTVASLLADTGHDVTILSPGIVAERKGHWHAGFASKLAPTGSSTVRYAAALDAPVVSQVVAMATLWMAFVNEQTRHPFDLVILYNFGLAEGIVADRAISRFGIPLLIEYEDDTDVMPDGRRTWKNRVWNWIRNRLASRAHGVFAPSPELLAQFEVPNKLLVRGILGQDLREALATRTSGRDSPLRVLFAGTIQPSKGIDLLCEAWERGHFQDAELHIVGDGPMRSQLEQRFKESHIRFHGFVPRGQLVRMLAEASVCVNPHRAGQVKPGSVFPFKMIEYLAVGCPVVSTRMGQIEPELELGICYAESESPDDLANTLRNAIDNHGPDWLERSRLASAAAWEAYGLETVRQRLCVLIDRVLEEHMPSQTLDAGTNHVH